MISYFAEIKIFRFWPKTMDYSPLFQAISFSILNSSLEGAMEPKFAPFCSCLDALLYDSLLYTDMRPKAVDYYKCCNCVQSPTSEDMPRIAQLMDELEKRDKLIAEFKKDREALKV